MADIVRESSQSIFSWLTKLRSSSRGREKREERGAAPPILNIAVIGLKDNAFDRSVYKALVSRTALYCTHDLNARYLQVFPDEQLLEKQLISFLNSGEFHVIVPIGFIPAKGLARLYQREKPNCVSVFTDVHEPIEHGIIDNPLTERSVITGLEELPVDYMKFIKSLTLLATRKISSVLIVTSLHAAQFQHYESGALQEALNAHHIGIRKLVITSPESFVREVAIHIDHVDAIIVPRDKMISPYAGLLAKIASKKRVLFCIADSETEGAAFNFGMPGEKLGIQTSDFVRPIATKSQLVYQVRMQRPVDETILKISKNALYEQGSFLDRDEVEGFDLCPFIILSE